jgi:serine/threonine-protein kinase
VTRRLEQPQAVAAGLLGTIDYVAPELIRGEQLDGRADEYSLGCLLYECLTGEPPSARSTNAAVLFAHLEEQPPAPPGLELVMQTALAKEPADRYDRSARTRFRFAGCDRALAAASIADSQACQVARLPPSRGSSRVAEAGWAVAYLCRVPFVKGGAWLLVVVSGCAWWSVVVRARGRPGLSGCSTASGSAT